MSSQLPFDEVTLLKDRNDKLSAQAAVHRQEIARLQREVDGLQVEEAKWRETVLCLNRLWEELNDAIGFMKYRASGDVKSLKKANGNPEVEMLDDVNPFLAKLLGTFLVGDDGAVELASSLSADVGEIERKLRERMRGTLDAANSVLEKLESREKEDEVSGATKGHVELAAMNSLLQAEVHRLKDQALQDSERIRDLQTSLADKEDELLVAKRKMVYLKETSSREGTALHATPHAPPMSPLFGDAKSPAASLQERIVDLHSNDVEQLKQQLQERTAEVDARDEALNKKDRELRDLHDKLSRERSAAERARQRYEAQASSYGRALDDADARLRSAYRECDTLVARLRDAQFAIDRADATEHRAADATRHLRDLEGRLTATIDSRRKVEAELEDIRARQHSLPTLEELKHLVGGLESDLKSARETAAKYRSEAQSASDARSLAANAVREAEESKAQLEVVRKRLVEMKHCAEEFEMERQAWKTREEELRLFAEVSMECLTNSDLESKYSLEQVRDVVISFLNDQKSDVKARLQAALQDDRKEAGKDKSQSLVLRVERLEEDNARLQARVVSLESEIKRLNDEYRSLREDGEAFAQEVEGLTEAYQTAQDRNLSLAKMLADRDDDNVRLMSEAAIATRELAAVSEEREVAYGAKRHAEEEARGAEHRSRQLELQLKTLSDELMEAKSEAREHLSRAEVLTRDLEKAHDDVEESKNHAKSALERASRVTQERDSIDAALRKERTTLERTQKELQQLQDHLKEGAGPTSIDRKEMNALRKMVNCTVCSAHIKNRIITRCNHIFCAECIDGILSARNRKCPGCGEKFGANDVKPFFFT